MAPFFNSAMDFDFHINVNAVNGSNVHVVLNRGISECFFGKY